MLGIIKSVELYLHGDMLELHIMSTVPVPNNSKQSLAWDNSIAVCLQCLELILSAKNGQFSNLAVI